MDTTIQPSPSFLWYLVNHELLNKVHRHDIHSLKQLEKRALKKTHALYRILFYLLLNLAIKKNVVRNNKTFPEFLELMNS